MKVGQIALVLSVTQALAACDHETPAGSSAAAASASTAASASAPAIAALVVLAPAAPEQDGAAPNADADPNAETFARAFPDVASFCSDYLSEVRARAAELTETASDHNFKLGAPSCAAKPRKLAPFVGDAMYKHAALVTQSDGITTDVRLIVQTPRGWVATPVVWFTDDPLDPGCPSFVRVERVESLRVESGHFVATLAAERATFDADGKYLSVPVRGAAWCKETGAALVCHSFDMQNEEPLHAFVITPDGTLIRRGERTQ